MATVVLTFALAACGGKSKPATDPGGGGEGAKVAADCCCEYVKETMIGDGSEDTAENMVQEPMAKADCDGQGGACVDAAQCGPGDEPVE